MADTVTGSDTSDVEVVRVGREGGAGEVERRRVRRFGRREAFTGSDDLVIVREVAAVKAPIAGFGDNLERCADAAVCENDSGTLREEEEKKEVVGCAFVARALQRKRAVRWGSVEDDGDGDEWGPTPSKAKRARPDALQLMESDADREAAEIHEAESARAAVQ